MLACHSLGVLKDDNKVATKRKTIWKNFADSKVLSVDYVASRFYMEFPFKSILIDFHSSKIFTQPATYSALHKPIEQRVRNLKDNGLARHFSETFISSFIHLFPWRSPKAFIIVHSLARTYRAIPHAAELVLWQLYGLLCWQWHKVCPSSYSLHQEKTKKYGGTVHIRTADK